MVTSQSPNMTDYEAERRSFQLEVPEYFNFATDVIGKWASELANLTPTLTRPPSSPSFNASSPSIPHPSLYNVV